MVKKILTTRPNHDIATSYLYDFSKNIIEIVKAASDFHITNLDGNKATRVLFEKLIDSENPGLIFLNGHGTRKHVCGHENEVILDNENVKLAKDKIVYALSCDSLEGLGPIAIKNGTKAYIGYEGKFMFVKDPSRSTTPSKDSNALPFKRACCTLINSLIFGRTISTAIEETKKEYLSSIKSYGTSKDDPYGDTPIIRFALAWNYEFLNFQGNPSATF